MRTIAENANDFASIRTMDKGNCIYVDKTDYFHRLVTAGSKNLFFIARPRRFGKSLMNFIKREGLLAIGLAFDSKTRQLVDAGYEQL